MKVKMLSSVIAMPVNSMMPMPAVPTWADEQFDPFALLALVQPRSNRVDQWSNSRVICPECSQLCAVAVE